MSELIRAPGPPPMPLLGASGNVLRFALDPLSYLDRLFGTYGRLAVLVQGGNRRLVSTQAGAAGTVFLYGPELNRELLTGHEAFHKCALSGPLYPQEVGERTRPLRRLLTGLFHVNGQEHRRHRRLLMPAFHKSRIETYREDMISVTQSVLESFRIGEVRDLRLDMMELTLRIATKTLFGDDMGEPGLEIARDLQRWLELFRPSAVLPLDLPWLPYRRWLDVSRRIDDEISGIVAARRASRHRGPDMLSMLLETTDESGHGLSDEDVIGHAGVIFAAGHETSANALAWTLFLLSQHPGTLADLLAELRSELGGAPPSLADLERLVLLDRVIQESMRILPPVPLNHRIAGERTRLGDCELPPGTEIVSSIYHTHRIAELYPEPERFRPERWENLNPGPYAYNPFSAGPRMCIGATFAMMEIKIVLAMLLQKFRLELVDDSRIDRFFSITLSMRPGLFMHVRAADHDGCLTKVPRVRGNIREMIALDGQSVARGLTSD